MVRHRGFARGVLSERRVKRAWLFCPVDEMWGIAVDKSGPVRFNERRIFEGSKTHVQHRRSLALRAAVRLGALRKRFQARKRRQAFPARGQAEARVHVRAQDVRSEWGFRKSRAAPDGGRLLQAVCERRLRRPGTRAGLSPGVLRERYRRDPLFAQGRKRDRAQCVLPGPRQPRLGERRHAPGLDLRAFTGRAYGAGERRKLSHNRGPKPCSRQSDRIRHAVRRDLLRRKGTCGRCS